MTTGDYLSPAYRALAAGTAPIVEPLANPAGSASHERYLRDPHAHTDDGHVRILDLETFRPIRFEPTGQQRELAAAWIDLERLAATRELHWRNVHEEKSRQEGITTEGAWLLLWAVMYHPTQGFVVHVNGDEVDDGGRASTYDSIFGKIRFMAEHGIVGPPDGETSFWPEHLRPGRYLNFRQRPSIIQNRLRPASYIRGAVQTPDPGRGRHYTHAWVDEAARLAWGESVQAALVRAVPEGRLYNSTPHGKGNVYWRLRRDRPQGMVFLTHHWTGHPVYSAGLHIAGAEPDTCPLCEGNVRGLAWSPHEPLAHRYPGRPTSPWYDEATLELTDEQVAVELEIDYEGSLEARVYPTFSEATHVIAAGIEHDRTLPLELGIDYGWGGSVTAILVFQERPDMLAQIAEVILWNPTPEQAAAELVDVLARKQIPLRDLEPRFTKQLLMVGDPAGDSRLATGGTLAQEYRLQGWNPRPGTGGNPQAINRRITAVRRLLLGQPVPYRISGPDCPQTIVALTDNRWPTDRTGKVRADATRPVNDVHNDITDALEYLVCWKYPPPHVDDVLEEATSGYELSELDQPREWSGGDGTLDRLGYDSKF